MFSCSLLLTLLSDLTREYMFPLLTLHFLYRSYFLIPHNGKPRRTFFFCFKCVLPPSARPSVSVSLYVTLSAHFLPALARSLSLVSHASVSVSPQNPELTLASFTKYTMRHFLSLLHPFLLLLPHCPRCTFGPVVQGCCHVAAAAANRTLINW